MALPWYRLQEKNCGGREYLEKARKVKAITDRYQIPLIIDDRVDVAVACDAAGVHVGSSDLPVSVARKLLRSDKIVGATAKTVEAAKAYEEGADYLGVGAIFPTTTKVVTIGTSVETLNEICQAVPIPAVAIGGLNDGNMDVLKGGNYGWNRCGISDHESRASEGSSTETESTCKRAEIINKTPKITENNKKRYGCHMKTRRPFSCDILRCISIIGQWIQF